MRSFLFSFHAHDSCFCRLTTGNRGPSANVQIGNPGRWQSRVLFFSFFLDYFHILHLISLECHFGVCVRLVVVRNFFGVRKPHISTSAWML